MIDKKTKELILRYIDGELSDPEKDAVAKLIKTNEAAAQFFNEMTKLNQILEEDKFKPDEVSLTESIMSEIEQVQTAASPVGKNGFWNRLFPDPKWNVAYALILGIILGFLIFSPFIRPNTNPSFDELDEIGTMYDANTPPVFKIPLNLDGISADITAHHLANDFVRIVVQITSDKSTKIRFSFNDNDFNVWTYKIIEQNFNCRILSSYNAVEVVNTGKNAYLILLKKMNHLENNIKVEAFGEEGVVFQELLTIDN